VTERRLLALALAAAFAVHASSLGNGYTMDDSLLAAPVRPDGSRNEIVGELQGLGDYFTSHYWRGTYAASDLYRPITVLSFAVGNALGGAPLHHLMNVLLHVLCAGLTWLLVRRVASDRAAVLGALVFGVHALHSEVVAGVVGRAELLAFAFGAGGALLATSGRWRCLAAAPLWFLACCSKESAVAWIPFAGVLAWAQGSGPRAVLLAMLAPGVVPLALFLWLRAAALSGLPAVPLIAWIANPLAELPAAERIANGLWLLGLGLCKTLIPYPLHCDYGPQVFELSRSLDLRVVLAVVGLAALLASSLAPGRRAPPLVLATAALFGFSFLTSNVPFPIGTIFAERLWFAPSLALPFVLAWLHDRGLVHGRAARAAVFLWCALSAAVAIQRGPLWRDDQTLLVAETERQPRSIRLLAAAAKVDRDAGRTDAAIEKLEQAVALGPDEALAWSNLAELRLRRHEHEAALAAIQSGLLARHDPGRKAAAYLHGYRGAIFLRTGRRDEAFTELIDALALGFAEREGVEFLLDALEVAPGRLSDDDVERLILQGERIQPGDHWAFHRGMLCRRRGDLAQAERWLRITAERVGRPDARVELASVLALRGEKAKAMEIFDELLADPGLAQSVKDEVARRKAALR
jgi:tetratricopeptide (TPR) repeat protein